MTSSTGANTPPSVTELEVSVFGPGVGESIAVHIGGGEWIIVDSCLRPDGRPAALAYLQELGVDVSSAVKLVIATHWHDDHIEGISEAYRACTSAEFVCSMALRGEEFLQLVRAMSPRSMLKSSGLDEFDGVIVELQRRKVSIRRQARGPTFAYADRTLLESKVPPGYRIVALSPSDASVALALSEIAESLPSPGTTKRRAVARRPNHTAVVIAVQVGELAVLLGSDLENTGPAGTGWDGVLSVATKIGRAHVFKVAHHGSKNGHHADVWTTLLVSDPHSVVTPFLSGKALPTTQDLVRLKKLSKELHITSAARLSKPKRRDPAVERLLATIVRRRRVLKRSHGQVRLRADATSSSPVFTVENLGTAAAK